MPLTYDSDSLVADVRQAAQIPDASDITAADILKAADLEMLSTLAEIQKSAVQGYWVTYEDVALSSALRYRYPRRALGRTITSLQYLDASGYERELHERDPIHTPEGHYYVEGDEVVFVRRLPSDAVSLRWRYLRRPSKLVPTASCVPITLRPSATTLTGGSVSTRLFANKLMVDIVRGDAPYDLSYVDQAVSGWTAGTYDFIDSDFAADAFVNLNFVTNDRIDYICPRDQTCYPPLPNEGWPLLVSRVARVLLEGMRDAQGAALADATTARRDAALRAIIEPRNEAESRPIVNPHSALRGGGWGYGGRRWR